MNKFLLFATLMMTGIGCAADALLPPRAVSIPCETEDLAFSIRQFRKPKSASRWIRSLDGMWNAGPDGLYTTTFSRPWRWWFRRTTLHLAGIDSACDVRVNGKSAGTAADCRVPVEFDLSPYLRVFGPNALEIKVHGRSGGDLRECYLVSEHKKAPFDLIVETRLSDDLKSGTFIVRDEKGNVLKRRDVPKVMLWSSECPFVYMTPIEFKWGWWVFGGTDYRAVTFGFKKAEFRGSDFYLNGKRVVLKGLNRCASGPEGVFAMSSRALQRDVAALRRFNVNAVYDDRGSDLPEWYDLCDRDGVMVVCDTNAEVHARLMKVFGNHPSIIGRSGRFDCDFDDFFDATRKPLPSADELLHRYQNISCEAFDFATGKVRVRNNHVFLRLEDNVVRWRAQTADGAVVADGTFGLGRLKPGEAAEFTLEGFVGDAVSFDVFGDRGRMAYDHFTKH